MTQQLPPLHGKEIEPGVLLIGEPSPAPDLGPNKWCCLANVGGALALVELTIKESNAPSDLSLTKSQV